MATPKKPYTLRDMEKMNAYLQRTQAKIDAHKNHKSLKPYQTPTNDRPLVNGRTMGYRKPFRHHPPAVQEKAKEWLNSLLHKYKDKIDKLRDEGRVSAANGYYGALVATATHMAKRDLGLLPSIKVIARKGMYRRNTRSGMKVKLGIKDQDFSRNPKPPLPCEINHGNLEGV